MDSTDFIRNGLLTSSTDLLKIVATYDSSILTQSLTSALNSSMTSGSIIPIDEVKKEPSTLSVSQFLTSSQDNIAAPVPTPTIASDTGLSEPQREFPCPKCSKILKTKKTQASHIRRIHPPIEGVQPEITSTLECPTCHKGFNLQDSLSKHIRRKHNTTSPLFDCTEPGCKKTFVTLKEQQNHIARHAGGPKIYTCNECNNSYTTKNSLNTHKTRIHGPKRFTCADCASTFAFKGDLNQHRRRKHEAPSQQDSSMNSSLTDTVLSTPHVLDSSK